MLTQLLLESGVFFLQLANPIDGDVVLCGARVGVVRWWWAGLWLLCGWWLRAGCVAGGWCWVDLL